MEEADTLAHELAIIDRGLIVAQGTPDQLKAQLEGDTVQVKLSAPDDGRARDALSAIDGLMDISVEGTQVRARATDGGTAVPAVLQALEARGITATAVTLARPSLDDVYLRHAGRAFHRAEHEAETVATSEHGLEVAA